MSGSFVPPWDLLTSAHHRPSTSLSVTAIISPQALSRACSCCMQQQLHAAAYSHTLNGKALNPRMRGPLHLSPFAAQFEIRCQLLYAQCSVKYEVTPEWNTILQITSQSLIHVCDTCHLCWKGTGKIKMKSNWPGWPKIARIPCSKCYRHSYTLTDFRLKIENLWQLWYVSRGDVNFCICSTPPLEGWIIQHGSPSSE